MAGLSERRAVSVETEPSPPCSPGNEFPGYPQTPLWGVQVSPRGAVDGSRGFQPPAHEARNDPGA